MKKLFIIFLFTLPFFIGCSSNNNSQAVQNIQIVEKYVQSVENLDYKTMSSLLDDHYWGYGPAYGDSINKQQALKQWKYNVEHLYKSIHYNKSRSVAMTIKDGVNYGDWVSNWGELHIVFKDGKAVNLWANTIYKIKNGKIVKSYTFYDEADALRQLGYVFVNPADL
jgi:ketosteroid isomerase-like protein